MIRDSRFTKDPRCSIAAVIEFWLSGPPKFESVSKDGLETSDSRISCFGAGVCRNRV